MKPIRVLAGLLALGIHMPIWYYLIYQMLVRINASEVMWLLFWVYVPLGIFIGVVAKIAEMIGDA